MKILNKELQSNLKEVCKLIQLNAKNKSKKKNFVFSVSVHDTFFVADILEFVNDESNILDVIVFMNLMESKKEWH